jgi:NAD(P)H-dependent flavin oxidoreductase YrpB (nitropropane dioxygenase family)
MNIPHRKLFFQVLASGYKNAVQMAYMANGFKAFRLATEEGNVEKGILPVGQVTGLLHDEPPVIDLMERMVMEAEQVQTRLSEQLQG